MSVLKHLIVHSASILCLSGDVCGRDTKSWFHYCPIGWPQWLSSVLWSRNDVASLTGTTCRLIFFFRSPHWHWCDSFSSFVPVLLSAVLGPFSLCLPCQPQNKWAKLAICFWNIYLKKLKLFIKAMLWVRKPPQNYTANLRLQNLEIPLWTT